MEEMWYVGIQRVDWEGYPLGPKRRIGLFKTKQDAELWLDSNSVFKRVGYGAIKSWVLARGGGTVTVENLMYTSMTRPEDFTG